MFNFPDVTGTIANDKPDDKTGDKSGEKPVAKPAASAPATTPVITVAPGGVPVQLNASPVPPGERALLERLQERRQELDARARELEIRENLIKAAEKRLETRVGELKDLEARVKGAMAAKDEADAARFKSLVTMYENMKAKDAAKIFDRLEMRILLEVATQINPRRMSDILAQMQPESAEKLTIELANRATGTAPAPPPVELPKIEGRPKAP
jgi:flagellar motility protein MotE (MotC chaperone)